MLTFDLTEDILFSPSASTQCKFQIREGLRSKTRHGRLPDQAN